MGIHDRDYYRREGPSVFAGWGDQGRVTLWLLGLNIAFFLLQALTRTTRGDSSPFTDALILNIDKVMSGQVWRLLSYAFLHSPDNILHIVLNMLMLWWFGRQVEERVGSREFLLFYLLSAIVGAVAYIGVDLFFLKRGGQVLGASGAVMAVLVVAACYNPRQVSYLFFVLPVPIWAFVVLMVLLDLFPLLGKMNTEVATAVHLGGAAFGFLYYRLGWRLAGVFQIFRLPGRSRPRLRLYREDEEEARPARPIPPPSLRLEDEHLEAQVDAILAKVSSVGMDGLNDHERQILLRASEAIKRRRG